MKQIVILKGRELKRRIWRKKEIRLLIDLGIYKHKLNIVQRAKCAAGILRDFFLLALRPREVLVIKDVQSLAPLTQAQNDVPHH